MKSSFVLAGECGAILRHRGRLTTTSRKSRLFTRGTRPCRVGEKRALPRGADSACEDGRDPRAISDKGPAAIKAVDIGQSSLFPEYDIEDQEKRKRENASLWYLFVYINGDDVRAELSFPKRIEDGQFKGFNERIYIIKPGEWLSMMPKADDAAPPAQDFDISVTRKS
jgi:hypothetical protein